MPMKFGIGKATLNSFLSPLVALFLLVRVVMFVDCVLMALPDVPGNYFGEVS